LNPNGQAPRENISKAKNKLILEIFHRTLSVTGGIKCVKKAKSEDDIALIAGITLDT